MFEIRIADQRINAFRVVKGQTREDVQAKAEAQIAKWNEMAARKLEQSRIQARREAAYYDAAEGTRQAELLTQEASINIAALERLLPNLSQAAVPTWSALKDRNPFLELAPTAPEPADLPMSPSRESFAPTFTFLDKVIPSRRAAKEQAATDEFEASLASWRNRTAGVEQANGQADERHKRELGAWQKRSEEHLSKQKSFNATINSLQDEYTRGTADGVEFVISEMLLRTRFPSGFPQGTNMSYLEEGKVLILDMDFPNQDVIPAFRDAKYVKAKSQIMTKATTDAWRKATYDSLLYQLALGLIERVFRTDDKTWVHSVVLNGWVQSVDKSTGADTRGCLLSLQVGRDEFIPLDLSRVDPKTCFRSLKGVASSRLNEMTPIKPIQQISKEDPRFIAGYSVVGELDERTNLAAMDWQDFENLIREIFEKEFLRNGGEVKITQASRDGGVDAVAFDPDPIRGGKIVIQAKRYVNTVGVSAVRDLYGTLQHEGAMKGILVTTATYGPDAYDFAKDKPITLISGGELLSMLERHGHAAKINLNEARALRS